MRKTVFEPDALEEFVDLGIYDVMIFKRIFELLKDIKRNSFEGITEPKPLKNRLSGMWSRRINDKHRLVYFVNPNSDIEILTCKGHYSDK